MPISKIKTSSITADATSVSLNIDAGTLYLDAANNYVGVGTTSPSTRLQVSGDTTTNNIYLNQDDNDVSWTSSGSRPLIRGNKTNNTLKFYTASSERVKLDSSGYFTIGSALASAQHPLQVNYADSATSFSSQTPGGFAIQNTDLTTNSVALMSFKLAQAQTVGAGIGMVNINTANSSGTAYGDLAFYTKASGSATLSERMRLTSSGVLAIGSSNNFGASNFDITQGTSSALQVRSPTVGTGDGTANVTVSRAVTNGASWWANARYEAYSHTWGYGGSATAVSALTITGAGVVQKTLAGDGVGFQLKGSYTGNPTLFEVGQSSSDGYLVVKDALGNTTNISGYPSGLSYFSSPVCIGSTSLSSAASASRLGVVDGSSWSSGFRNHTNFTMPNMTGGALSLGLGKAGSTYNLGKLVYNHAGDGNNGNSVGIGFWDKDNILVTYANGSVWIGDSTPGQPTGATRLLINNWTTGAAGLIGAVNRSGNYQAAYISASNPGFDWQFGKGAQTNNSTDFEWGTNGGGGTVLFRITSGGNIFAYGSVNGSSKNFVIDHPLPEKKDTHYLVHTSTESPTADLIYRGKVNLVAGKATINIDEESTMTNGTFEAMLHNVQCFTSNESDWVHVRGKVEGNILTIEAQDATATSLISWMVIGERKDEAMKKAAHTDENGKIIVEPLKAEINYDASKDPTNPDSPDYDPSLKPVPVKEEQQPYPTEETSSSGE